MNFSLSCKTQLSLMWPGRGACSISRTFLRHACSILRLGCCLGCYTALLAAGAHSVLHPPSVRFYAIFTRSRPNRLACDLVRNATVPCPATHTRRPRLPAACNCNSIVIVGWLPRRCGRSVRR